MIQNKSKTYEHDGEDEKTLEIGRLRQHHNISKQEQRNKDYKDVRSPRSKEDVEQH